MCKLPTISVSFEINDVLSGGNLAYVAPNLDSVEIGTNIAPNDFVDIVQITANSRI